MENTLKWPSRGEVWQLFKTNHKNVIGLLLLETVLSLQVTDKPFMPVYLLQVAIMLICWNTLFILVLASAQGKTLAMSEGFEKFVRKLGPALWVMVRLGVFYGLSVIPIIICLARQAFWVVPIFSFPLIYLAATTSLAVPFVFSDEPMLNKSPILQSLKITRERTLAFIVGFMVIAVVMTGAGKLLMLLGLPPLLRGICAIPLGIAWGAFWICYSALVTAKTSHR